MKSIQVSIVIPTCNRRDRLLSLLSNLDRSVFPVSEVIIVDSGEDKILPDEYARFSNLTIRYIETEKSVCIQRNTGIKMAVSPWIFLCDDDMEIPADYLETLVNHVCEHPDAGAVSGRWLQKEKGNWEAAYPIRSSGRLLWKFIFQLGIWGEILCRKNNIIIRGIKNYYQRRGNHISRAGWPVNTAFGGDFFICPVYSLGAALIKKEWLLYSPFDEVLDRHGIGDNYGVAAGFPAPGIHVVNKALAYHHLEPANRLEQSLQYYRRVLALDYFARTKPALMHVKKLNITWSLFGNLLSFLPARKGVLIKASFKAIIKIVFNRNPYSLGKKKKRRGVEPLL